MRIIFPNVDVKLPRIRSSNLSSGSLYSAQVTPLRLHVSGRYTKIWTGVPKKRGQLAGSLEANRLTQIIANIANISYCYLEPNSARSNTSQIDQLI